MLLSQTNVWIFEFKVTSFVSQLAKSHEDWQVLQARDAVRLHLYFSDKSLTANSTVSSSDHEWVELNERMTNALRLRHRSYRTEQSYKAWVRRFGVFLENKAPHPCHYPNLFFHIDSDETLLPHKSPYACSNALLHIDMNHLKIE